MRGPPPDAVVLAASVCTPKQAAEAIFASLGCPGARRLGL